MSTPIELAFAEHTEHLQQIAEPWRWDFKKVDGMRFILGLPARDGLHFWLLVECDQFPVVPPAWHWYNPETGATDQPRDTPRGTGYFHSSGRICAPWNRLAYQLYDPRGPHNDWELANWATNPHTRRCDTLAAMALRIAVELQSPRFKERMGE